MPAPPAAPWFIPTLKPSAFDTDRSTRIAVLVSPLISSVSSAVVSV